MAQTYRGVQATAPGQLELADRPVREPGPGRSGFAWRRWGLPQ